VPIIAVGDREE